MKTLFVIKPHSMVDVITNSSSELFVFNGDSKESIKEIIKSVYPNYLDEYHELVNISEISIQNLDIYFSYACSPHSWPAKISDYPILPGFTFDELYEPERDWQTNEIKEPAWNGEFQYRLKQNEDYSFITKENFEEMKKKLSPNNDMFFLFSKDDNPNWDYQDKLMNIGYRYHLG